MYFRNRLIMLTVVLLSLAGTACSPAAVTTESTPAVPYETSLAVPYPESPVALAITSDLPGMIRVIGDSGSDFVTGTVQVSNQSWFPKTGTSSNKVSLIQTTAKKVTAGPSLTNLWKLRVSDKQPFRFDIRNRQAEGHWNFSGLPITYLYAELGAAKNAFTFDEQSTAIMQKCELYCGSGDVVIEGILNAACQDMAVAAGQGTLTLRFGGKEIMQDMKVTINAGSGAMNITLLADFPARVTVSGKNRVIIGDGVEQSDTVANTYETAAYRGASDKAIEITVSGGTGVIYLNPLP